MRYFQICISLPLNIAQMKRLLGQIFVPGNRLFVPGKSRVAELLLQSYHKKEVIILPPRTYLHDF